MLNLGLIGDIQLLEPFTKGAQSHPGIYIAGKSSVGIHQKQDNFRLSAPEFNRLELIERSDALLINRFSLLPFQLLCDIVKKSKHFFATSYPRLTLDECAQLTSLAHEAKTVIQVVNPFYYLPAVQWLNKNLKKPAFIEVTCFNNEIPGTDTLIQLLLMLKDVAGTAPKKTNAFSFQSTPANAVFNSVQMEQTNGSVVTIHFGTTTSKNEFLIKTYARDQFTVLDITKNQFTCNHSPINLVPYAKASETDAFINSIVKTKQTDTGIEDYSSVIQMTETIQSKLDRYTPHK